MVDPHEHQRGLRLPVPRASSQQTSQPAGVADGVWLLRGGMGRAFNVFLVRDGDGVLAFDAGVRRMAGAIRAAARRLGGLTRVVLGHAHADHRGAAPALGVPVLCHEQERSAGESARGEDYFDYRRLRGPMRWGWPVLLRWMDGGPVKVASTLREGDALATFRVLHLPGHSAGLIGLWRAHDRLALVSDAVYVVDPETLRPCPARVPHPAFTLDPEQARASIRRLAGLEPKTVWPGHGEALTGSACETLERLAAGR